MSTQRASRAKKRSTASELDGVTLTTIEAISETIGSLSSTVIESGGSNATGFYKKYADGTLEAYGRKAVFLDININYGYLYRTGIPVTIAYPNGCVFKLTNFVPAITVSAKDALVQTYGDSAPNSFMYTESSRSK